MGVIGLFLNKEPVLECTFPDGGTMTISEMLQQSGILTLLGMGVVFAFLVVMIACMHLLHAVIHVCKLDKDVTSGTTVKSASAPAAAPAAPAQDDAAVAAIAAAVHSKK